MDTEQLETLKYLHTARGEVYTFFDKFFRLLPNEDFFSMVEQNIPYLKELSDGSENEDMCEAVAQLQSFFDKKATLDKKEQAEYLLEALRAYTSLFCLAKSVPAVESYYTDTGGYTMGEAYSEMRQLLRKYGISRSEEVKEYEDHISVESAFMARLAFMSVDLIEEVKLDKYKDLIEEQFNFHKNHFDRWVNAFVEKMLTHPAPEQVFKAVSKFMRGYISEDKQILSEII